MGKLGARVGVVGFVVGFGVGACEAKPPQGGPPADAALPPVGLEVPAAEIPPQTAKATFRAMQLAACEGDAAKLLAFVDEAQLRELTTDWVRNGAASIPYSLEEIVAREQAGLPDPTEAEVRAYFAQLGDEVFRHGMKALNEDIARGRDGELCRARVERVRDLPEVRAAEVKWTTPSGESRTWSFGQRERGWALIVAPFAEPYWAERDAEEASKIPREMTPEEDRESAQDLMNEMLGDRP